VQSVDDGPGRALWREHGEPAIRFISGNAGLLGRRHIRQDFGTFARRDREGSELAAFDLTDDVGNQLEAPPQLIPHEIRDELARYTAWHIGHRHRQVDANPRVHIDAKAEHFGTAAFAPCDCCLIARPRPNV